MTIRQLPRLRAVRRKTLAACLAAALAAGTAGAAGFHRGVGTGASSDQAIFGELRTTIATRSQQTLRSAYAWSAFDLPAHPTGVYLPVENCLDDGSDGSLRQVFSIAQAGDTIDLSALDNCQDSRITLLTGAINVQAPDLTVVGPGQDKRAIDGNNTDRVFQSKYYGLTIKDVTIANGFASNGFGGCIDLVGGADLTLTRSTVTGCHAGGNSISRSYGGAVYVDGNLTLYASTISASSTEATDAARGGGAFVRNNLELLGSTLSGNTASAICSSCNSRSIGGGAYAGFDGQVTAYYSTISDNKALTSINSDATAGGGGLVSGTVVLRNSTVSRNIADGGATGSGLGGGILVYADRAFNVTNSTVAFNAASTRGGGIHGDDGKGAPTFVLDSSIVANNDALSGADIGAGVAITNIQGGHNLVMMAGANIALPADTLTSDPMLHDLAPNGGPTATHALDEFSPAIDAGDNNGDPGVSYDQRGCPYSRVANGIADIGAFEFQTEAPDHIFGDGFDHALLCP